MDDFFLVSISPWCIDFYFFSLRIVFLFSSYCFHLTSLSFSSSSSLPVHFRGKNSTTTIFLNPNVENTTPMLNQIFKHLSIRNITQYFRRVNKINSNNIDLDKPDILIFSFTYFFNLHFRSSFQFFISATIQCLYMFS